MGGLAASDGPNRTLVGQGSSCQRQAVSSFTIFVALICSSCWRTNSGRPVSHVFIYLPTLGFRFSCLYPSQLDVPPPFSPPPPPPPPLLSYHPDKPSSLYMRCRSISTRYSLITSPPSLCPLSLSLSVCSLCVWSDHMSI